MQNNKIQFNSNEFNSSLDKKLIYSEKELKKEQILEL